MIEEHIAGVDHCSVCLSNRGLATRVKRHKWTVAFLGTIIGETVTIANPIGPAMETLVLSSNGSPVTSSTVLTNGQQYWLLAEGTYVRDFAGDHADAEYAEESAGVWVETSGGTGPEPNHDVVVNAIGQDWLGSPLSAPNAFLNFGTFLAHTYSPSHFYWLPISGTGATFQLKIADQFTGDNSGSLTVRLFADYPPDIPTVSQWGLIVMAGLVAVAGGSILRKRRVRVT